MRFFRQQSRRLLVIGLDCADPHLVFDDLQADLPTISRLMDGGTWGILHSSFPCITVPAWSSMTTSRDPGALGFYGFRNRGGYDYNDMVIADGAAVRHKRIWDYASDAGKNSIVVGVPQTYPTRPLNGHLVSGFLTPGTGSQFTYPAVFKSEVLRHFPDYAFDTSGFRTDDKDWLRDEISHVTAMQFQLMQYALTNKPWDFAMLVNMGTDRVHHGFWRYHDPSHRFYESGNPYENVIRNYYKQVDRHIADLLNVIPDDTTIMIVSDHGVRRMDGGICINEWLWRNGWLTFHEDPPDGEITRLEDSNVDWSRTKAWGAGGYYGRVFLNVAGREPNGTISPADYEKTRTELSEELRNIPAPDGTSLSHTIKKPEDVYTEVNNIAPDLMVYFGDLHWRSVGSLGHGGIYTTENDTGPDDANHAPEGLYLLSTPQRRGNGRGKPQQLMDIAPTALDILGIDIPPEMQGRSFKL